MTAEPRFHDLPAWLMYDIEGCVSNEVLYMADEIAREHPNPTLKILLSRLDDARSTAEFMGSRKRLGLIEFVIDKIEDFMAGGR